MLEDLFHRFCKSSSSTFSKVVIKAGKSIIFTDAAISLNRKGITARLII